MREIEERRVGKKEVVDMACDHKMRLKLKFTCLVLGHGNSFSIGNGTINTY